MTNTGNRNFLKWNELALLDHSVLFGIEKWLVNDCIVSLFHGFLRSDALSKLIDAIEAIPEGVNALSTIWRELGTHWCLPLSHLRLFKHFLPPFTPAIVV